MIPTASDGPGDRVTVTLASSAASLAPARSKTVAAWLALVFGTLGAHRFYLHGVRDVWAWLFPVPTLIGLYGFLRMRALGVDDVLGWMLVPLLGLMVSVAMLSAIVCALTSDANWQRRHNLQGTAKPSTPGTGVFTVLAAIFALLIGGAALMATIAFTAQKFFEWQMAAQATAAALQPMRVMA